MTGLARDPQTITVTAELIGGGSVDGRRLSIKGQTAPNGEVVPADLQLLVPAETEVVYLPEDRPIPGSAFKVLTFLCTKPWYRVADSGERVWLYRLLASK